MSSIFSKKNSLRMLKVIVASSLVCLIVVGNLSYGATTVFGVEKDINGDGKVDYKDIDILSRYLGYYDYDSHTPGFVLKGADANGDGILDSRDLLEQASGTTFDEDDPKVSVVHFYYEATDDGQYLAKTSSQDGLGKDIYNTVLDKNGQIVKVSDGVEWYENGIQKNAVVTDATGHFIMMADYEADGKGSRYYKEEYDSSDKLVKFTDYDSDGVVLQYFEFEYENEFSVVAKVYDSSKILKYTQYRKLDERKRIIEVRQITPDGKKGSIISKEYNEDDVIIRETYKYLNGDVKYVLENDSFGRLVTQYEYLYDEKGLLERIKVSDSLGRIVRLYDYEYEGKKVTRYTVSEIDPETGAAISSITYDCDGNKISE